MEEILLQCIKGVEIQADTGREISALESGGIVRLRLLTSQETPVRLDNTTLCAVAIRSLPVPTVMRDQAIDLPSVR
jgi:hypothetical protein